MSLLNTLNTLKTNILVIAKPSVRDEADDLRIITDTDGALPKKSIKMFGLETNVPLFMEAHLQQ